VAETELFRRAIAESIRMNLWLGDKGGELETGYTSFDGLLKIINERVKGGDFHYAKGDFDAQLGDYAINEIFDLMIRNASPRLKGLYNEGQVAVNDYFKFLSSGGSDSPVELLKLAGVDLTKMDAFNSCMASFKSALEEFESLN
jgi:hypothetical protein